VNIVPPSEEVLVPVLIDGTVDESNVPVASAASEPADVCRLGGVDV
jgi:hypothetical protein